jgi:predicted transcriptional regulator
MEVHALQARGWTVSAIARHLGRDRKTIRAYLNGERQPAVRKRTMPDPLARFEPYLRARLADDQHVWATVLFAEIVVLGYERSYPTFVRQLRQRGLRHTARRAVGAVGGRRSRSTTRRVRRSSGTGW